MCKSQRSERNSASVRSRVDSASGRNTLWDANRIRATEMEKPPVTNDSKAKTPDQMIVMAGGVHLPAASQWTEDRSLPELPTMPDDTLAVPVSRR